MSQHLQDYLASLTEFHETFLQPVVRSIAEARFDKFPLRVALIAEEYAEYFKAKSRVEIIDALGDLLYVTVGTMLTTGVLSEEYSDNCTLQLPLIDGKYDLLFSVLEMLKILKKDQPCYRGLHSATTGLYWRINRASVLHKFDLYTAFKLIHKSNMTKVWSKENMLEEFDSETMESNFRSNINGYIVSRKSDSKTLKPSTYTPVDLTKL